MEYNINNLKTRFVKLGGVINGSNYSTPRSQFGECSEYESSLYALLGGLEDKYASKMHQSPDLYESFSAEYEQERKALETELFTYQKNHPDYELFLIETILEKYDALKKAGVPLGESFSMDDLHAIFIGLGGDVCFNKLTQTPVYVFNDKPKKIKDIEAKQSDVNEEIASMKAPTPKGPSKTKKLLLNKIIGRAIDLRDSLTREIKKHPEYSKIDTLIQFMETLHDLEVHMSHNHVM